MSAPTPEPTQPKGEAPKLGELLKRLSDQVTGLVSGEIELAKAKLKAMLAKLGAGGALLAVAGVLALYLLGMLLWAASYGFAHLWAAVSGGVAGNFMWAGVLSTSAVLLLVILVLAGVGAAMLKKAQKDKPDPKAGMAKSVESLKKGLNK